MKVLCWLAITLALSCLGGESARDLAEREAPDEEAETDQRAADQGAVDQGAVDQEAVDQDAGAREDDASSEAALEGSAFAEEAEVEAFLGTPDAPILRALREEPIARIQHGLSGRSLAFQITLADGTRAYFKPEQTFSSARWYAEIAAYHLDRMLGLGRTAPVVGRVFNFSRMSEIAASDRRLEEAVVDQDGFVRGALIHWIEGEVREWNLGFGWEASLSLDRLPAISPFQRNGDYVGLRNGAITFEETELSRFRPAPTYTDPQTLGALSDLILFDYLTSNLDRWGGWFTNVQRLGEGGPLLFLDNGAGFWPGKQRHSLTEAQLGVLHRFRRETVARIEAFRLDEYEARLNEDALAPILNERQLRGLQERVDVVIAHVEAARARYGEAIWIE